MSLPLLYRRNELCSSFKGEVQTHFLQRSLEHEKDIKDIFKLMKTFPFNNLLKCVMLKWN